MAKKNATIQLPTAYHGAAELLLADLASIDGQAKALAKRDKELRAKLAKLFISEDGSIEYTSFRSVWGLVTMTETIAYGYDDAIVEAEIRLKSDKETARTLDRAEILSRKPTMKISYSG